MDISTLKGFLDYLKLRIEMLPKREIGYLEAVVTGYTFAKYDEMKWFSDFANFVALKFGHEPSSKGWKSLIMEEYDNNEEKAIDAFFELFDEYAELNKNNYRQQNV